MDERKRVAGFYALEKLVTEALQWRVDNGALVLEAGTAVSDLVESNARAFTISARENGSKNGFSRYPTTLGEGCELQESSEKKHQGLARCGKAGVGREAPRSHEVPTLRVPRQCLGRIRVVSRG